MSLWREIEREGGREKQVKEEGRGKGKEGKQVRNRKEERKMENKLR